MEADFQREYGINLVTGIRGMTWRRFSTLLRGLGPESAVVSRAVYRRAAERSGERVVNVRSEDADRHFNSLFKPPG